MKSSSKASVLLLLALVAAGLLTTAQAAKLTVTKIGTGTGTITSSPAGINCGATCNFTFANTASVTLTAAPSAGSTFTGWSGTCTGTATTCTVTANVAKTATANFVPVVALTLTKAGTGAGTVTSSPAGISCGTTCSANFNQNSSVTLTAAPSAGSTFTGWAGACTGTTTKCTVAMSAAKAVTATFTATQVQLTVTKAGTGAGTVTDPRILEISYQMDNLGNLLSLTSLDTGTTQNTYDEAGNLKTKIDARGKVAIYSYDSQNRLTQVAYEDQAITYTWDSCANGIGRLCSLANGDSTITFNYDSHGRITNKA